MLALLAFMAGFMVLWLLIRKGYLSTNPMDTEDFKTPRSKKKTAKITALTEEDMSILKNVLKKK